MKIQPRPSMAKTQSTSAENRTPAADSRQSSASANRMRDAFQAQTSRPRLDLNPQQPATQPAATPSTQPTNPALIGLAKGSTDKQAVEQLQHQLVDLGYLTEQQVNGYWGTFGPNTEKAVRAFQSAQGLPVTGQVDEATAAALANPRPAIDSRFRGVAAQHQEALGRPTGEPVVGADGSVTQQFDNGSVTMDAQGGLHVQGANGLDVTYEPGTTLESWAARGIYVDQMAGDPNSSNANCGFASAHMALSALGLPLPTPADGTAGTGTYPEVMELRRLGGGGTNDGNWGTVGQVVSALNAAGANAATVPNTWGSDKAAGVDVMKQAFLDPSNQEAFVVAGNPSLGWPESSSYNGGHFVTVVGYDPAKDKFIVMDPYVSPPGPIEVTPEQLANYMTDGNAEAGEIIQVTRP